MTSNGVRFVLMAALVLGLGMPRLLQAQSGGGDQGYGTGNTELDSTAETVDMQTDLAPLALLTKLSQEFGVDLATLQALAAQGYRPGEIWLALTLSKVSGQSLQDVLALTAGKQGHGWGQVAALLGVKPGSTQFLAMVREANTERASLGQGQGAGSQKSRGAGGSDSGGRGHSGQSGMKR